MLRPTVNNRLINNFYIAIAFISLCQRIFRNIFIELFFRVENLQEASHDKEKLKAVMKQRDEKISSLISSNKILEAQIHELELQ